MLTLTLVNGTRLMAPAEDLDEYEAVRVRQLISSVGRYSRHYDAWFVTKPQAKAVETLALAGGNCWRRSGWHYMLPGVKRTLGLREALIIARRKAASHESQAA